MKYFNTILIVLFACLSTTSQTVIPLPGYQAVLNTFPTVTDDTVYTATFSITDFSNQFNGTNLLGRENLVLWRNCNRYPVLSVEQAFATSVTLTLNKAGNRNLVPGVCALLQETPGMVSHLISGITDSDRQCIDSYYRVDALGQDSICCIDTITYDGDSLRLFAGNSTFTVGITGGSGGGSWDSLYNGNRNISRVPIVGQNLQANTFREWLNWWYIGNYTQPTLSLNALSPSVVEVGSSTNYTLSGSTTNPCTFTLSSGTVNGNSFGAAASYSYPYTHNPVTTANTNIQATQAWNQTGTTCQTGTPTTGTAISPTRTINNVYPILWGMSATVYNGGSVPYNIWSKRIAVEGNQTGLTMTGTNMYIYILIPKSWSDWTVSTIIDHNGFNVTPSFTGYDVTVTSTGLTNNWTQAYRLYKLNNLTTASGFNYIYNR